MTDYQVAIIGAGPAGIAAAIQLSRSGMDVCLFEKAIPGGLLFNANWVENYPGFPEGIRGMELAERMAAQLAKSKATLQSFSIKRASIKQSGFSIRTIQGEFTCDHLIVASGTEPNQLGGEKITGLARDRIFYEVYPICTLIGHHVAIIGAGDAAFDYALNLSHKNRVTILNRTKEIRCLPLLWERARQNQMISYLSDASLIRVTSEPDQGLSLFINLPGGESVIHADYLLAAIGRHPALDFLDQSILNRRIELEQANKLFIIGDVKNGLLRQTAIATGEGVRAAMQLSNIYREMFQ